MIGYRHLPLAREDLNEAAAFYEASVSGLGEAFLDDVERAVDMVRENPRIGIAVGRGFRRTILRRFPFTLIYAERPEEIVIVADFTSAQTSWALAEKAMTANNAFERTKVRASRFALVPLAAQLGL